MSRGNVRLLAGALTLLAGLGAWVIGKKAGEKVAKATEPQPAVPPAQPAPDEPVEAATDAVEVKPA